MSVRWTVTLYTTPRSRSVLISSSPYPSDSRTALVSWPSCGGAWVGPITCPSTLKPKNQPTHREIVAKHLGYRGLEVLQNAEYQFPKETQIIIQKLAELISSGDIKEVLDGGQLFALFRSIGINVRMKTKISVEKDGKFVSISDKLRTKSQNGRASCRERV